MSSCDRGYETSYHAAMVGSYIIEQLSRIPCNVVSIPHTDPVLFPFLSMIPMQLLSYYMALRLGHNVDQPRNLAKSATVE
ncbi:hypothetical protein JCM12856_26890 [Spirochaeta dissipatitropha]